MPICASARVEETVTVTGEAPIVDVQNTTQQRVFDQEVVDALPTARLPSSLGVFIPGMTTALGAVNYTGLGAQEIGGAGGDTTTILAIHGGQSTDYRQNLNGLSTGWANEAFETLWVVNTTAIQEVVIDATAVSAEAAEGGVRTNLIPRDGGNTFSGVIFASFANDSMAGSNFDDESAGARHAHAKRHQSERRLQPGFGGPVRQDRLWFYSAARYMRADAYVGDMFINRPLDDLRFHVRSRYEPARDQRRVLGGRAGAPDVAGDAEAQVRVAVESAEVVQVPVADYGHDSARIRRR